MLGGMAKKQRCSECRRRFEPAASAVGRQKVCSERCRLMRRGKQRRQRRQHDLINHRDDEKRRQQECRARKRKRATRGQGPVPEPVAAGVTEREDTGRYREATGSGGDRTGAGPGSGRDGHAPASEANSLELQGFISEIVATVTEVSRTTLRRELARLLRKSGAMVVCDGLGSGPSVARAGSRSRTSVAS